MIRATIEIRGLIGLPGSPTGGAARFLLTDDGDPDSVSLMLLQAARVVSGPDDLPRGLLSLGKSELCAGNASFNDHCDTTSYHYQLWAPLEGCALMVLVRAVRAEKGRREWYVRSGPMSLESFLLAYQEVPAGELPLWSIKDAMVKRAA